MRQPSARPSLYTSEVAEGRDTRGIAINFDARGGGRPLGRRDIAINVAQTSKRRLVASTSAGSLPCGSDETSAQTRAVTRSNRATSA
jgi:hypothetical protein